MQMVYDLAGGVAQAGLDACPKIRWWYFVFTYRYLEISVKY